MTSNTASNKPKTKGNVSTNSSTNSSNKSTNPKKNPKQKKSQSTTTPPAAKKKTPKLATTPPLECSQEDFDALLGDASGLSNYEEAATELLDCARYGMLVPLLCISCVLSSYVLQLLSHAVYLYLPPIICYTYNKTNNQAK